MRAGPREFPVMEQFALLGQPLEDAERAPVGEREQSCRGTGDTESRADPTRPTGPFPRFSEPTCQPGSAR